MTPLSRREFLAGAGAAGGGLLLGGLGGYLAADAAEPETPGTGIVEFHGAHQAGILTPQQDRLHFASFDVKTASARELRELLEAWTAAAARMTRGEPAEPGGSERRPPRDSGEATGLGSSRLTITFGFGPTLFERAGRDRFGLRRRMPRQLKPLPALPGDRLEADSSGGDLCVQACSDDPQTAFHAIHNLTRIGHGVVEPRWSQTGFGRTSSTTSAQATPRNLMGFKDGTNNITAEELPEDLDAQLWAQKEDGQAWMSGGTYLVTRRIEILLAQWDATALSDQEATFGRRRESGAPLTGRQERDVPDYNADDAQGKRVIPEDAHIRNAAPENSGGIRMLRRGYSYANGLESGLFFIACQRDPHRQFVPIQTRLAKTDRLNDFIVHRSSALFAVPPGVPRADEGFVGAGLFR